MNIDNSLNKLCELRSHFTKMQFDLFREVLLAGKDDRIETFDKRLRELETICNAVTLVMERNAEKPVSPEPKVTLNNYCKICGDYAYDCKCNRKKVVSSEPTTNNSQVKPPVSDADIDKRLDEILHDKVMSTTGKHLRIMDLFRNYRALGEKKG